MSRLSLLLVGLALAFAASASAQHAEVSGMQLQDLEQLPGFTSFEVSFTLRCLFLRACHCLLLHSGVATCHLRMHALPDHLRVHSRAADPRPFIE